MTRDNRRVSILWLLVLEMVAVIASAVLFLLNLLDDRMFLIVLLSSIVGAIVIYSAVSALVGARRRRTIERQRAGARRPAAPGTTASAPEPDEVEELMKLGRHYLRERQFGEAVKMFEEVLGRRTRHYQAYNYLGRAYAAQGYYEEAKAAYEKAIGLEYDYASAHFNLATAHEKVGEIPQAVDRWRTYLEIGSTIGERPDWLEHARQRIKELRRDYADLLVESEDGREPGAGGRHGERES